MASKYRVFMSLGYHIIVEAANEEEAIGVALDQPDVTVDGVRRLNGEWGEGIWDSDTLDVELVEQGDGVVEKVREPFRQISDEAAAHRRSEWAAENPPGEDERLPGEPSPWCIDIPPE